MNIYDELLNRVQAGEDPMAIANEFADVLNKAVAAKQEADASAKREQEKADRAQNLIDTIDAFIKDFYPEIWNEKLHDALTGKDLVEIIDESMVHMREVNNAINELKKFIPEEEDVKNDNDPIAQFLREFNLN